MHSRAAARSGIRRRRATRSPWRGVQLCPRRMWQVHLADPTQSSGSAALRVCVPRGGGSSASDPACIGGLSSGATTQGGAADCETGQRWRCDNSRGGRVAYRAADSRGRYVVAQRHVSRAPRRWHLQEARRQQPRDRHGQHLWRVCEPFCSLASWPRLDPNPALLRDTINRQSRQQDNFVPVLQASRPEGPIGILAPPLSQEGPAFCRRLPRGAFATPVGPVCGHPRPYRLGPPRGPRGIKRAP